MNIPEGPLRLQEDVLNNVIHCLRTAFGIAVDSHTSDAIFCIFGVGQGSQAGPVSWARVSSLLFQAQDTLGHGAKFTFPRLMKHSRHSDSCVDDTTVQRCDQLAWLANPSACVATPKFGNDSCGRLAVHSRSLNVSIASFNGNSAPWEARIVTAAEANFPIFHLTEGKNIGQSAKLDQLDCNHSFRTLGTLKRISGDQSEQIRILWEKSDNGGKGITASSVTKFEAWTGHFTIWCPSCNCPLAATFLQRKDCEKIQSFAACATLMKCGISRHFPRAVVFGAPKHGRLRWRRMWHGQGIQHVLSIAKHLQTPGPFQSLLQINLRWHALIAGVSFAPLEFPAINLLHLDSAWLDST
jgi:hypothetical protein